MKILHENFPLALYRSLRAEGQQVEHIITLGRRGAHDQQIRELLDDTDLLFLTQDEDFLFGELTGAVVVLSRVRQSRPLTERVGIWRRGILDLERNPRSERRFELMDDGSLVPWEQGPGRSWTTKLSSPT